MKRAILALAVALSVFGIAVTPAIAATTNGAQATISSPADLPEECTEVVRYGDLSAESQDEFETALDEDGLVREELDAFRIADEIPNVDDQVGQETCVRFEGAYYYALLGPGIPSGTDEDGSRDFEYELRVTNAGAVETDSDGPDVDLSEYGLDWDGGVLDLSEYGFSWEGGLLDPGDYTEGIDNRNFTVLGQAEGESADVSIDVNEANDRVVVEGTIVGSDGCTGAVLDSATYDHRDPESLDVVVRVTSTDDGACIQRTNPMDYRAVFDIDGDLPNTIDVTHLDQEGDIQFQRGLERDPGQ
jgi:hypothetical protein